jgi:hypothetical protein
VLQGARKRHLVDVLKRAERRQGQWLSVQANSGREARNVKLRIQTIRVVLDMYEHPTGERYPLAVNVVDAREVGTTPPGEEPIHWRLFTNQSIATEADVQLVLLGYRQRWRIEDLHKTWKSGACNVEDTQLRSTARVIKWAILTLL